MSTCDEIQGSKSLDLSWPKSVPYQIDEVRPTVSNPDGNPAAEPPDIDSQTPVTTYNGIPRETLRNAQKLFEDEIRVLDLRRGAHEDPLVGTLRKVRVSDPIVYEPVSYTWKDYDTVDISEKEAEFDALPTIFLENVDSFMNIGTNCEKALRSIRQYNTERRIWVDAICVNQDDTVERSHQVDLMRKIFARAFTVLVYLGQESMEHDSSMAMSLLGQPDRMRDSERLGHDERSSLTHLFERPYFRRMWIVQEVALASTLELHCGPAVTYLSAFANKPLGAILGSSIAHPPWLKHSKYSAGSIQRAPATGMSRAERILRLIFDTVSCSCHDDRDRVFALLSLLRSSDEGFLRADYNLSTTQVYTGVAAFLATNGLAWAVLTLAPRLALNGYSDLPSWVPNWKMLGNTGLEDPKFLDHMIKLSLGFGPGLVSGVTRFGAITVRGKTLGPIAASDHGMDYMAEHRERMRQKHQLELAPLSSQRSGGEFTWMLTKPAQSPFDDSWECHIESGLRCKPPSNVQYLAFMLEDTATVLVLRQDGSYRDQYTLVEVGMPLVWGVIPRDWAWGDNSQCIDISLRKLSTRPHWYSDISLPPDRFPRLWEYSHLWRYNPATYNMTLKHQEIGRILSTDFTMVDLWLEWQKQAHNGVQILSDETRLQLLIDETHDLEQTGYKRMEIQSGLAESRSLDDFLCLFVKDPSNTGPMEWPNTQMDGDQSYEETDALPLLVQWAAVTDRILVQLRLADKSGIPWLVHPLPQMEDLSTDALAVARSHRQTTPIFTDGYISRDSDLASFHLQKILQQLSKPAEPMRENERSMLSIPQRFWNWKKFESTVEERVSILRHVRPEIESLRSFFTTITSYHADAHQVLAAHGVDLTKQYTEIRIK